MTHTFRLNPPELDRLAGALDDAHAGDYRNALAALRRVEAALAGAWAGPSRAAFQTHYGGWIGALERIGQDLPAMAAFLRATADEYRRLDRVRSATLFATQHEQAGGAAGPTPPPGAGAAHKIGLPTVADLAQAQAMFEHMRQANWDGDPEADMPWGYTLDGCYARADKMSDLILEQYGFRPWKVWAFDMNGATLNPNRAYVFGEPGSTQDDDSLVAATTWGWHVAPIVRVPKPDGALGYDWYVIDPSIASGPLLIREWTASMQAVGGVPVQIDTDVTPPDHAPRIEGQGRRPGSGYTVFADPVFPNYTDRVLAFYDWCDREGEFCAGVSPVTGQAFRVINTTDPGFDPHEPLTWQTEFVPETTYTQP